MFVNDLPLARHRHDSPLESIMCRPFALARLALGNYPWLYGHRNSFGCVLALTATTTRAGITAMVCRLRS
jgi:hypothetical protein